MYLLEDMESGLCRKVDSQFSVGPLLEVLLYSNVHVHVHVLYGVFVKIVTLTNLIIVGVV